jgi:transposase InsO family protein
MGRKRHTVEQIIRKLREREVELAKGSKTPQVCRKLGISEQTYCRWRKKYGGMQVSPARRLKELERKNARLKMLFVRVDARQRDPEGGVFGKLLSPTRRRRAVAHVRQIEHWRREYNQIRPHSCLGYRPPAPEAVEWPQAGLGVALPTSSRARES